MSKHEQSFGSLSERDRRMMDTNTAYIKARERVEAFLGDIDPDLEVNIQESLVTPNDASKTKYSATTLSISHRSNPFMHWTMEIGKDDEYTNENLEAGVRKIYQDQSANAQELTESWPWYETARQKAESFLPNIDPELLVSVEKRKLSPDDPHSSPRDTVVLRFQHRTNSRVKWTMSIEPSREYIDNQLEQAVIKIYQEHKEQLA